MEKLCRGDGVEACFVAGEHACRAGLAFQGAGDERFGGGMFLVGVCDVRDFPLRGVRVDEHAAASVLEFGPFEVRGNVLRVADDVRVHCFLVVGAATDELQELLEGLLNGLHDVSLKGLEVFLYGNKVLSAVVFLQNLFVEVMLNPSVEHVGIVMRVDLAAS